MSLATKYRPQSFNEVIGQQNTCTVLKTVIENDTIPTCMIFSGKSGVGKTTLARIFNKELNQSSCLPIEIDGASHGSVDTIRDIVLNANERSLQGKYKVIIIDECHVLSSAAWSSLLKTLEETPKYTCFILCTTELNKIPLAIQNRAIKFNINSISFSDCFTQLAKISKQEQIRINKDTLEKITKAGNGSLRTAISLLERFATGIDIKEEIMSSDLLNIIYLLLNKEEKRLLQLLQTHFNAGTQVKTLINKLLSCCVDIVKYYNFGSLEITQFVTSQEENIKRLLQYADFKQKMFIIMDSLMTAKAKIIQDEGSQDLFICYIELLVNRL